MANTTTAPQSSPDWWAREKQKRQGRVLIFLVLLLLLIGFFYWVAHYGRIGSVGDLTFDTTNHIVFVNQDASGNTTLYTVGADGSELRPLTDPNDKSTKREPAWTSDGKSVMYAANRSDSRVTQIYILGNGDTKQLTYGSGNKFAPVASSDGKHVAFVTAGAIKTVLRNGNDVEQALPPPRAGNSPNGEEGEQSGAEPRGPFLNAAFGSDGVSLAGVQALSPEDNLLNLGGGIRAGDQVVRALPTGAPAAIFLETGREVSFAWDPNGGRIACSFTELKIDPTSSDTNMLSLDWLADEKKLGSKLQTVNGIRIWDLHEAKPKAKSIFSALGYTLQPKNLSWSSDGKYLAFEVWRFKGEGERELRGILVIDASHDGGGVSTPEQAEDILKRVTIPAGPNGKPQMPRWSPDGSRLLYEMQRPDGGRDLWVINSDGTNPINITKDLKGDNGQAAWSPIKK